DDIRRPVFPLFRGFDLHVKACDDRYGYSPSWVVAIQDPLYSNPSPRDLVLLATYDSHKVDKPEIRLLGMIMGQALVPAYVPSNCLNHKVAFHYPAIQSRMVALQEGNQKP